MLAAIGVVLLIADKLRKAYVRAHKHRDTIPADSMAAIAVPQEA